MSYKFRYTETYKGKRIDIKSNTKKEEHEKLIKARNKIDNELPCNVLLSSLGREYIEVYKKPVVSEHWYYDLKLIFEKHILPGIGDFRINEITPLEVQNMLNKGNFSKDYTKKIYNVTCQIFSYAYKKGLTKRNLSEDFVCPNGIPTKAGRSLTEEEEKVFLKVIKGHRGEMLCRTMYYCGLRTAEARNLKWKDVDLKRKIIHVRGTKTNNADRIVPIPNEFLAYLKEHKNEPFYMEKQSAEKAWRNVKRLMNIEMGCRTYRNKLIPPFPVQEPLRLYDLRHTYCTNLEKKGVPITIAARLMGHSSVSLTAKIYTHESDTSLEIARNLINK